jgi:hypothetical protein
MADTQSARTIAYSRAPFSTWLGVVFLFVLFGLIVLAVIGPSPRTSDYEETRAKKRMEKLKALHEETQKDLTTYAWVDKSKGVARIPIDRAMELTVTDLAQKKPAPAGPIATPAAQAAPAAAAPTGASPAPACFPAARHGSTECACRISCRTRRRVARSCTSTITGVARFSRTGYYAMNTEHFDCAS